MEALSAGSSYLSSGLQSGLLPHPERHLLRSNRPQDCRHVAFPRAQISSSSYVANDHVLSTASPRRPSAYCNLDVALRRRASIVSPSGSNAGREVFRTGARKRMFDDPFDYGEDPNMTYGEMLSDGRQDAQEPRPPNDPTSEDGYLLFPKGYNVELASLGLYIRGDVRKCAILVAGGVYESLLFFPVIQLLKEKYPGVEIDVVANERAKQTYELNKNVGRAWVYDVDDPFVLPADYVEMLGKLKNNCYDLVMSTRAAGMGHAMFLFLTDARQRVSYVAPTVNGAGAGYFLSTCIRSESANLPERGYNMYSELVDILKQPTKFAPGVEVKPLEIGISKKVLAVARAVCAEAGVLPGNYLVLHGLASESAARMHSLGDPDSHLSVETISQLVAAATGEVLVVVPHARHRVQLAGVLGPNAHVTKIATPGQLAAVVSDSVGVITANTAALQFAMALRKPSVALFGSAKKASLFAPSAQEVGCTIVASESGELKDISIQAAQAAVRSLSSAVAPVLA